MSGGSNSGVSRSIFTNLAGILLLPLCYSCLGLKSDRLLGDGLGHALGVKANVGGVGIAMLLLISARLWLHRNGRLSETSERGVHYWGALYIPVVVAMAMQQNVMAALHSGPVALLAAVGGVAACFALVAVINRTEPEDEGE